MKSIGLVVPCYNEQATIKKFYYETNKVFKKMKSQGLKYSYKYLFINDGSQDHTLKIIKQLQHKDPQHVHYISFSRNFGIEAGMAAGFNNINTDYTAKMDVDLQDPPELILKMVHYLENGYDCVGCIQVGRHQSKLRSCLSRGFYWFINKITSVHIKPNVRDFRLMNRQFLNSLMSLHERNRFSKGLMSWVGYKVKFLKFKSRPRSAGTSDWSLGGLFQYSLEAIIDFSDVPLRISTFCGIITCLLSMIGLITIILRTLLGISSKAGWPSLACIILFLGGVQLFCLGIVGKYIGKIYSEVKHRPLYIIKESK